MLAQLFKVAPTMQQIDELFQWLAVTSVQRFNVQLMQFWTSQLDAAMTLQLRTLASQDAALPAQITVNNDVALVAQRMAGERRIYNPQLVENLFSTYRATLMKRYGLNYCTGSSINAHVQISLPGHTHAGITSPFAMTILLLTHKQPHVHLMPSISSLVDQAIIVGGNRGMLLATGQRLVSGAAAQQNVASRTAGTPARHDPSPYTQLVPRRKQDTDTMLLSSPFSGTTIIADKRARRLYTAIDERANIAALCKNTGIGLKEVYVAINILLQHNRIELYEPNGKRFNALLPLDNL